MFLPVLGSKDLVSPSGDEGVGEVRVRLTRNDRWGLLRDGWLDYILLLSLVLVVMEGELQEKTLIGFYIPLLTVSNPSPAISPLVPFLPPPLHFFTSLYFLSKENTEKSEKEKE